MQRPGGQHWVNASPVGPGPGGQEVDARLGADAWGSSLTLDPCSVKIQDQLKSQKWGALNRSPRNARWLVWGCPEAWP